MPKLKVTLTTCFSLFLFSSALTQSAFAASVETEGDLKVNGWIESTSGGFKFPDGTLLEAAGLNGFLFNVGFVVDDSNSNAGNLNSGAIKFGTGATGEAVASQRITSGIPSTDNINGLDFYTNSTSRLSIANDGYVGIGTRKPEFPLDVYRRRGASYAKFGETNALYMIASLPQIGFNMYFDGGFKYGDSSYAGDLAFGQDLMGGFSFATAPSGTADAVATRNVRMVITNDGKVGIGTTTPAEALDVTGNIKASGDVTAGAGATHTPFAYGSFWSNGTKSSGSANLGNCTWNTTATPYRYDCPLTGYNNSTYVTVVTPVNLNGDPVFATTSYGGVDALVVRLFNMASATPTTPVQGQFHLVVFKP